MATIAPGGWLGLLGGGQLGRMFCLAAQSLGYKVVVLDPAAGGPAASVAERHIAAGYLDAKGLAELAQAAPATTTEFENVPAAALDFLANSVRVAPAASSVAIAQDRISEKTFLRGNGFAVAPFAVLRTEADFATLSDDLFPGIVKSARLGYDGKGQASVNDVDATRAAWRALGSTPCVLERRVALVCEISVVVARDASGALATWPATENRHRDGILDVSIAPARLDTARVAAAREIATGVASALAYCGVLCVEMFVTDDDELLVNEIAPRPHNSGHYTIDACVTSQFEQQARVLAGLPFGDTRQHTPAVMVNLLGDIWFDDATATTPREPDWNAVLRHPAAKLHLYGKAQPRRARKMGHVTCLGATIDDALATARTIRRDLGISGTL